ncbi:unnamed protein product [Effrenium voratum]|nr:unnamed protein product [Effrenium voratum]
MLASRRWPGRLRSSLAFASAPGRDTPRILFEDLKQKFGHIGAVNQKQVGVWNLFEILRVVRSKKDVGYALQAMNLFYNFGVKLKHRQLSSRLLAATMIAKHESEAVELVKLYGTWLDTPPDSALVYAVMSKCLDDNKPMVVRELAKLMREDWRFQLEAPLYSLAVQGMLQLPKEQDPMGEAFALLQDAAMMGVRLQPKVHLQLLDECLQAHTIQATSESDEPDEEAVHLDRALKVADGLARDGHVTAGSSAALCSISWLLWHLSAMPSDARHALLEGCDSLKAATSGCKWVAVLELACASFASKSGFAPQLPGGLFRSLEASDDIEAQRMVKASHH